MYICIYICVYIYVYYDTFISLSLYISICIYLYIYIYIANTIPAKICRLNISRRFPVDMRIPPLRSRVCLSQAVKPSEIQNLSTKIGRIPARFHRLGGP